MVKNTFFENISVYNYFRKNNEDTFFLENLILFKNDVLIIFSKISGFCSISQFSKEKWFVELKTHFLRISQFVTILGKIVKTPFF